MVDIGNIIKSPQAIFIHLGIPILLILGCISLLCLVVLFKYCRKYIYKKLRNRSNPYNHSFSTNIQTDTSTLSSTQLGHSQQDIFGSPLENNLLLTDRDRSLLDKKEEDKSKIQSTRFRRITQSFGSLFNRNSRTTSNSNYSTFTNNQPYLHHRYTREHYINMDNLNKKDKQKSDKNQTTSIQGVDPMKKYDEHAEELGVGYERYCAIRDKWRETDLTQKQKDELLEKKQNEIVDVEHVVSCLTNPKKPLMKKAVPLNTMIHILVELWENDEEVSNMRMRANAANFFGERKCNLL